jgi:uncharacterized protein YjbI with pentapeptide repeats
MKRLDLVKLNYTNNYPYANSLNINEEYLVNCVSFNNDVLRIHTGTFDKTTITGSIKNIKTKINTVSIIYNKVTFENCIFENTRCDWIYFNECIFLNCMFSGDMRWVDFDKCNFFDTYFDMNYIRRVTFKKNCIFKNMNIKAINIDEYIWLFGKRYSKSYHPLQNAINLNF